MHPACSRLTKHDTGLAVKTQFLKDSTAILSFKRNFADPNFVANHLNRFFTLQHTTVKAICS